MNTLMQQAFDLTGQVALITGGGSGLGFAMAKCLAAAGASVIITGRRADVLEKACEELGSNAHYAQFDVTDTAGATAFVAQLTAEYGSIDILINNAGRHCKKPVEDVTTEDFQGVLDVHLLGAFALTQAVLPAMRAKKRGSVLFVSSMSALLGLTKVAAYSAAKSAVLGLVKAISGEVSCDGVRINAIVPGFIDTPMFHQATDKDPARQQKILGHTPMNCYGDPMDIGWAAVYLCSNSAKFITGTSLVIDGGCAIGF
ncbi:MAG: SDR family NAD(P)-dependent oxidoreductase [Ruthenibacterium sp.]